MYDIIMEYDKKADKYSKVFQNIISVFEIDLSNLDISGIAIKDIIAIITITASNSIRVKPFFINNTSLFSHYYNFNIFF
jgi:hypothetical protein